jgi:hypothetical protein
MKVNTVIVNDYMNLISTDDRIYLYYSIKISKARERNMKDSSEVRCGNISDHQKFSVMLNCERNIAFHTE